MRPVNLIPSEDRPGARRPMRGGPLAYIVLAALAAALIGVTVLVITDNQISERKTEVTQLETEKSKVEARAQALDAYTQFHSLREQRLATVASLADSRFDWERVMRELALVLPGDVWLTNLTASASPSVTPDGAASVALRPSIPGPALELVGCARSQNAVARFVEVLEDIDGATRVGVESSALGASAGAGSGASASGTCQTRRFIAQFQLVVAFDAAPVNTSLGSGESGSAPAPAPAAASEEESSGSSEEEGEGEG